MSPAVRILLGLGLGLFAGTLLSPVDTAFDRAFVATAELVGGLWLDALRMTIVPLVFALIVSGIASTAGAASAGGVTRLSIILFVALLALAAVATALLAPMLLALWPPPAEAAAALREGMGVATAIPEYPGIAVMLRSMVPSNPVAAAAAGAILPLVLFALVFGFACAHAAESMRHPVLRFFEGLAATMLVMIHWILRIAPLGVFALASVVGARTGLGAVGAFAHYVVLISLMCILAMLAGYLMATFVGGVPLRRFMRAAAPAQAVAISTQSSLASLPAMLEGARQQLDTPQRVAGVTLPLAVSIFRITGPVANLAVAIYIATVLGIDLGPAQLAAGGATAVVMVFAGVGVPSQVTFFAVIAPICLVMGIPIEMLALLIAVETIPDIFRTTANVTVDLAVATVVTRASAAPAAPDLAAAQDV